MSNSTAFTRVKAWLVIEGRWLDLVGFSESFAINEIPVATAYLPVGRKVVRGQEYAMIHKLFPELLYMKRAGIWVRFEGEQTRNKQWPGGLRRLFDGYITGIGFQRRRNSFSVAVKLTHWLTQLSWSCSLNELLHPSTPTAVVFNSTLQPLGNTGAGQELPLTACTAAMGDIGGDVWKSLQGMLIEIAEKTTLNPTFDTNRSQALENTSAIEALRKTDYFNGPTLSVKPTSPGISDSLRRLIGSQTVQAFSQQTFWDKMVGVYSPMLMFIFSPRVEDCLVRPFVYSHRKEHTATLKGEDYTLFDFEATHDRPIRGIALYGAADTSGDGLLFYQNDIGRYLNAVWYPENCEECKRGSLMFLEAPPWITNALDALSSEMPKTFELRNSPVGPVNGIQPPDIQHEDHQNVASLAQKLCQCYYVRESLRHRVSQLSGRLRFDICPGSTVRIEGSPERVGGANSQDMLSGDFYATVSRVTIAVNAAAKQGGTAFELNWCRTRAENKSDRFSVEKHPVYEVEWAGDPLIKELA